MTHQTFDYVRFFHQQGFRVTPQRQLILDAICDGKGHTSFEEIHTRVRAKSSSISLPTIYRNLDFLCSVGLVINLHIGNKTYYEIVNKQPHHHLICRKCGRMDQVSHATVKSLFARIKREYLFQVDVDHLALFGLCRNCRTSPAYQS